jgi:hypothetical protein
VTKEISVKRKIRSGIVYSILSFMLLTGWSLASPPGSSPDEDLHLSSAWYLAKYPDVKDPAHPLRDDKIPLRITDAGKCYFNSPNVTSICETDNSLRDANYSRIINNSGYYTFLSNFVSPTKIDMSTLIIRMINSLIASIALFVVLLLTPRGIFLPVLVSWLIVNIPLGFFILSSVNPSSWSFIFSYLFLPLIYKVLSKDHKPNSIAISLLVLISAFLLAREARFDILLFAVIFTTSLLPIIFNYEQMNKRIKTLINLSTLLIASALTLAIWNRSLLVGFREEKTSNWENLTGVPSLITGAFGGWGLGSLETTMPAITFVVSFVTVLSIIFIALREINISESISLGLLSFFGFIVPLFVLVRSNLRVGEWLQPRYILPIFYVLLALSLIIVFKTLVTHKLMIFINFIFLISTITFITSLHTVYRRYTVGLDNYTLNFREPDSWWWDFNYIPSPIIIYLLTVVIFIIFWFLVKKDILAESRLVSPNDSEQRRN